jgi:hypothetical protein
MVKQILHPGLEREDEYNCLQCSEAITNPICHNCLAKGIKNWMSSYPKIKKEMTPKLKSYLRQVNELVENSVNCVSCNKKAALCPYCFTEGVLNLLKKNKINEQIIQDFLSIFNFDFKHEGYIKDAISEGKY